MRLAYLYRCTQTHQHSIMDGVSALKYVHSE
jgi:hypothetical protein